ncbi:MAG: hypothetical protein QOG72_1976 [Sphingomonadales bacterium]|jgi:hypothetical protein|nr:hypothetical protein [Sphingomonadales bacterium]
MNVPPRNGEGDRAKPGGGGPRVLQAPIETVKLARKLRKKEDMGFMTLRIPAQEVFNNLEGAVLGIVDAGRRRGPLHHASHGLPPRSGEEL